VDQLNTGSLIQHMFTSQLASFTFPLPPLAEQHRIVAEVEARTTAIDHLEAELDRQITRSSRLRQSTLSSAFQGLL
jgi:restriction endonuclease S subunit